LLRQYHCRWSIVVRFCWDDPVHNLPSTYRSPVWITFWRRDHC
jgi:hypothetical protein